MQIVIVNELSKDLIDICMCVCVSDKTLVFVYLLIYNIIYEVKYLKGSCLRVFSYLKYKV